MQTIEQDVDANNAFTTIFGIGGPVTERHGDGVRNVVLGSSQRALMRRRRERPPCFGGFALPGTGRMFGVQGIGTDRRRRTSAN